jgi:tRNA-binding EMAP/Myf-like protein
VVAVQPPLNDTPLVPFVPFVPLVPLVPLVPFVPLAPVGAVLPGDFIIAKRKMRGVESNGMLCSAREIGLGGDHAGLMLLTTVEGATPGAAIADVLGITPDVIF